MASVFSPKKRKNEDKEGVLSEPIGHYWQTLFESGEKADVLVCVKGENGGDVMIKVRRKSWRKISEKNNGYISLLFLGPFFGFFRQVS